MSSKSFNTAMGGGIYLTYFSFGFLDGISQPLIKGLDDETAEKPGARKYLTRPG
jgi:hypothetical protein